jgi:hypothetical protein
VVVLTGVCVACLTAFYTRVYTFDSKGISIADHNNQLIETIDMSDIYGWNETTADGRSNREYLLILDTIRGKIVLSEGVYRNYEEIVSFFSNSNITQNRQLGRANYGFVGYSFGSRKYTKVERNIIFLATGICISMLLVFGLIVSQKVQSDDIVYLYSKVVSIDVPNKGTSSIKLADYPDIDFKIADDQSPIKNTYFTKNNKTEFIYLGKKVKIGVLKSEYDWKIKNKLIGKMASILDAEFEIERFEMLPDSAEITQ